MDAVFVSPKRLATMRTTDTARSYDTLEMITGALGVSVEELCRSEAPVRTGRVKTDVFDDLKEEEAKLLRRIWVVIRNYVRNGL